MSVWTYVPVYVCMAVSEFAKAAGLTSFNGISHQFFIFFVGSGDILRYLFEIYVILGTMSSFWKKFWQTAVPTDKAKVSDTLAWNCFYKIITFYNWYAKMVKQVLILFQLFSKLLAFLAYHVIQFLLPEALTVVLHHVMGLMSSFFFFKYIIW